MGRRIKGTSYHPWTFSESEIPNDKISENDLILLLKNIRENTDVKESIQKIILGHMRLALTISGRYLTQYNCKQLSNDLDGSALLGLTVGANRLTTIKHDNVTGFLVLYIHNYITDYIHKSAIVYTPRGKNRISTLSFDDPKVVFEPFKSNRSKRKNCLMDTSSDVILKSVNAEELLEELTQNAQERRMAVLKISGFSLSEIAEILGVSLSQIYLIRKRIGERYNERK